MPIPPSGERTVDIEDTTALLQAKFNQLISNQTHLFIVDDEGLLFSDARGEIYHLNSAATFIWCAIEAGVDRQALVAGLCERCQLVPTKAEDLLDRLIAQWLEQGVFCGQTVGGQGPIQPAVTEIDAGVRFPVIYEYARAQNYRVLNSLVRVEFHTQEQARWLLPSLTHFETDDVNGVDHVLRLRRLDDRHHVFLGHDPLHTDKQISQLAPYLKNELVRLALHDCEHMMNLHAGVVRKGEALVALPGDSGDGKSTLVAGLVKAGYRYFSDEIAPIKRDSCSVIPLPLGICVKSTAFPTLQPLYPEIQDHQLHDRVDGRRAVYLPPPRAAIADMDEAMPITHIVFPKYRAGAAARIAEVNRVEAFARLMAQCVYIPQPLTVSDVAGLVQWIEGVRCYELVSGSLDDSISLIENLLE